MVGISGLIRYFFSLVLTMLTSVSNDGSTVLPRKGQSSLWIITDLLQITRSSHMQILKVVFPLDQCI